LSEDLPDSAFGEHAIVEHAKNIDIAIVGNSENEEMPGIFDATRRIEHPFTAIAKVIGTQPILEAAMMLDTHSVGVLGNVFDGSDHECGIALSRMGSKFSLALRKYLFDLCFSRAG
jgi:hypothetical protein